MIRIWPIKFAEIWLARAYQRPMVYSVVSNFD